MTEHLPECPKSGCPACYEQGQRDCALTHAIRGLKDINRIAARGYDDGQRDAIAAAVQRVQELAIPPHFPVAVTCDVLNQVISQCIAAIRGDQP